MSLKISFSKMQHVFRNSVNVNCRVSNLRSNLIRNLSLSSIFNSEVQVKNFTEDSANVQLINNSSDASEVDPPPVILGRQLELSSPRRLARQAWVENLDTVEEKKVGIVDLHPDIFGVFPRLDIVHTNVTWQQLYKKVSWAWTPTRGELQGGGRKPWPQKGLGKARHGSIRSPIWLEGSKAHGPRGPKSYFFKLGIDKKLIGLTSTLSVKFAQDDLKVVPSLDIPSEDPKFVESLMEARSWGVSVLFVDDGDIVPKNIALATDTLPSVNLMPTYGLNVYSMLKHETLVLTVAALNKLEERLLSHINRHDYLKPDSKSNYK